LGDGDDCSEGNQGRAGLWGETFVCHWYSPIDGKAS
jgi:hypothetical protein